MLITQIDIANDVNFRFDKTLYEIFGIGRRSSTRLFAKLGLNKFYNFYIYVDSTEEVIEYFMYVYFKFVVGLGLRKKIIADVNKITSTNNWRAQRAYLYLPTRGQRSRKNAMTQKLKRTKKDEVDPVAQRIKKNMERRARFFSVEYGIETDDYGLLKSRKKKTRSNKNERKVGKKKKKKGR